MAGGAAAGWVQGDPLAVPQFFFLIVTTVIFTILKCQICIDQMPLHFLKIFWAYINGPYMTMLWIIFSADFGSAPGQQLSSCRLCGHRESGLLQGNHPDVARPGPVGMGLHLRKRTA